MPNPSSSASESNGGRHPISIEERKLVLQERELALKEADQRRANVTTLIQSMVMLGGLATLFLTYMQYTANSQKEYRDALLKTAQLIQSAEYKAFNQDLGVLYSIVESYVNTAAKAYDDARKQKDTGAAYAFFDVNVVREHRASFDRVLYYFSLMEQFSKAGPCHSRAVRVTLTPEARLFWWYFDPVLGEYARARNQEYWELYGGLYNIAYGKLPDDSRCS
jgi:hypothetical protein